MGVKIGTSNRKGQFHGSKRTQMVCMLQFVHCLPNGLLPLLRPNCVFACVTVLCDVCQIQDVTSPVQRGKIVQACVTDCLCTLHEANCDPFQCGIEQENGNQTNTQSCTQRPITEQMQNGKAFPRVNPSPSRYCNHYIQILKQSFASHLHKPPTATAIMQLIETPEGIQEAFPHSHRLLCIFPLLFVIVCSGTHRHIDSHACAVMAS